MHFSPEKYLKDASVSHEKLGGWSLLRGATQTPWTHGQELTVQPRVPRTLALTQRWATWQRNSHHQLSGKQEEACGGTGISKVLPEEDVVFVTRMTALAMVKTVWWDTGFLAVDLQPPRCCWPIPWGMDSPPPRPRRRLFCLGLGPQGDSFRIFCLRNL